MLIPRVRLVGRVFFTGTGAKGTMTLPSNLGAHALIRSLYVSSARRSNILNIIEYPRYMALCRAGTRPEDRFSDADDLSSPSMSISRGQISSAVGPVSGAGASSASTAIPFSIELEQLNAGLFNRQLPFAKFGNFEVQISLSSAAEAMTQDAGNIDCSFTVAELSLCYNTAPVVGTPSTIMQPQTFIRPEVQRLELEGSRMTITQPYTQTLISAGIIFTRQTSLNNVAACQSLTEAPPGLESVKFSMLGEDMQQYDVVIQDAYAAQAQTGFFMALLGAGLPITIADSVVARASAGDLRWRFANTDVGLGSSVLPINGVGVPDSYGLGIAFPPAGANGNLAVSLEWTPGATSFTAHLVLFYLSSV
jgi:hypothetical protein